MFIQFHQLLVVLKKEIKKRHQHTQLLQDKKYLLMIESLYLDLVLMKQLKLTLSDQKVQPTV